MAEIREDALLNGRQVSESMGLTQRAFQDWKVQPRMKKGRQNLYALADVLRVYEERKKAEWRKQLTKEITEQLAAEGEAPATADGVDLALNRERLRLTSAQADAAELKNEVARHEVAPFSFITYLIGRVANEIAGVMDGLPNELMQRLALTPKEAEQVKAATAVASDAITQIADPDFVEKSLDEFIAETDQ